MRRNIRIMPTSLYPPHMIRSLGTAALDMTEISVNDDKNDSNTTLLFTLPITPVGPMYDSVSYNSLDEDRETINKILKFFYVRLFNRWLFRNDKLLKYFKVSKNSIKTIKTKKEYRNNDLTSEDKENIVGYIIENIYDKYDLKKTLKRYSKKTDTRFIYLPDNVEYVKDMIFRDIIRKIKQYEY